MALMSGIGTSRHIKLMPDCPQSGGSRKSAAVFEPLICLDQSVAFRLRGHHRRRIGDNVDNGGSRGVCEAAAC